MIKKQHVKSRNVCKVTFELPPEFPADEVELIADFTGWKARPFAKLKNGKWKLVEELAPGQQYQFRYRVLTDGREEYINDETADGTIPNELGTENAVIAC